jgi:hypothetical protein
MLYAILVALINLAIIASGLFVETLAERRRVQLNDRLEVTATTTLVLAAIFWSMVYFIIRFYNL